MRIIAGLATMPSRAATFPTALHSIIGQVDRLYLYLDGHREVPAAARDYPNVVPVFAKEMPNLGGAGKFIPLLKAEPPFLFVGVDDDMEYPDDHVATLRAELAKFGNRAVIGCHGSLLHLPFVSYFRDRSKYAVGQEPFDTREVDVLAASTVMFDTSHLHFDVRAWPNRNTSDLYLALAARQRGLPMIRLGAAMPHPQPLEQNQRDSIYAGMRADDSRQTALARELIALGAGSVRLAFFCPEPELVETMPRNPADYWPWIIGELDRFRAARIPGKPRGSRKTGHGPYGWSLQGWMYLRGEIDVQLSYRVIGPGVTLAHSDFWPDGIEANERQFFVELKADRALRLQAPDAVICQTPEDPLFATEFAKQGRVFWVQNWLQNGLVPRNQGRQGIAVACYQGNRGNLLEGREVARLTARLAEMGVSLCTPPRLHWNDYAECDVVIAVRNAKDFAVAEPPLDLRVKPAAKLINAWHAGVPAILSPEPSYERLRRSDLDYLQASNVDEIIAAVKQLQADPELYAAMVSNGAERAGEFTIDKMKQAWVDVLHNKILPLAKAKFDAVH